MDSCGDGAAVISGGPGRGGQALAESESDCPSRKIRKIRASGRRGAPTNPPRLLRPGTLSSESLGRPARTRAPCERPQESPGQGGRRQDAARGTGPGLWQRRRPESPSHGSRPRDAGDSAKPGLEAAQAPPEPGFSQLL